MAQLFMKRFKEFVAGITVNILICSVPQRLTNTLEICISKHVFNSKVKKLVKTVRFKDAEFSSILDVKMADVSRLVCRRRTDFAI